MELRLSILLAIAVSGTHGLAQQLLWRIDAPAAGPFGAHLVAIGDRDSDGHDDIATTVYVPAGSSASLTPEIWFFSGRTGQPIGQGRRDIGNLGRAGDSDSDGVADYVDVCQGQWLPYCAPWRCVGVEVRSGRTDAVIWAADMRSDLDMGQMLLGDLDLDGDGGPDVLVGSSVAYLSGGNGGVLHAFSNGGQWLYDVLTVPGEQFAPGLAKFIDYNGDGRDDFLLGMYESSGRGAVDIRSGQDGTLLRRIYGVPPILWGHGATAQMTGDLDGDGVPDILSGDSGPGTPGVIEILSSVSGNLIHRWQVNTVGGDDFGWPTVACVDVDRDGVTDVIANAPGGPVANMGQYIFSGRDGSLIQHYVEPTGIVGGTVVAMPPPPGEMFPRFAARGSSSVAFTNRTYFFSGAPGGVVPTGAAGRGTLATAPHLGVREFEPSGFRITLSGAEPSAPTFLVLGFSQPSLPYFDLQAFGFQGCTLFPSPDLFGFSMTGHAGLASGYAAHDFSRRLLASPIPGQSYTIYAQWVTLGQGPTWPGGVSEAVRMYFR